MITRDRNTQMVDPETGFLTVDTRLRFQLSRDLRMSLNEFTTIEAQREMAIRNIGLVAFSQKHKYLKLGNGRDKPGEDSRLDGVYSDRVAGAHDYTLQLNTGIGKTSILGPGMEIKLGINFSDKEKFERDKLTSSPLFPRDYIGPVDIYVPIPRRWLTGTTQIGDAYNRLEVRMGKTDSSRDSDMAPFAMHVTAATVSHRWPEGLGPDSVANPNNL